MPPPELQGLPEEVVTCLQNARFLHLATSSSNTPHISLMNYTYLPTNPYNPATSPNTPTIIMTTPPSSRKTHNLASNPRVSLLVHDWVSHRPPTISAAGRAPSPTGRAAGPGSGSLAALLLGMNTASLGRISTTINGEAELVSQGSEEEAWYKAQHLANHTFEESSSAAQMERRASGAVEGLWGGGGLQDGGGEFGPEGAGEQMDEGDGGTKCYVEGEEVRVVVVRIRDGRIADWKGQVRDWTVGTRTGTGTQETMVNGV